MLAAGTGITPMYQALDRMFGLEEQEHKDKECKIEKTMKENNQTRVILLYASSTEKDIYFKKEMDNMKKRYPNRLEIIHVISDKSATKNKPSNAIAESKFPRVIKDRINKLTIQKILDSNGINCNGNRNEAIQVWVCGPPSFYSDLCGSRDSKQLTGVLKDLNFQANEVVKF